jgi:hypothetical protein
VTNPQQKINSVTTPINAPHLELKRESVSSDFCNFLYFLSSIFSGASTEVSSEVLMNLIFHGHGIIYSSLVTAFIKSCSFFFSFAMLTPKGPRVLLRS